MAEHELKTWPEFYQEVVEGHKPFEYRLNDRDYRVGDVLHLREWVPPPLDDELDPGPGKIMDAGSYYTGRSLRKRVTYVLEIGKLGPAAGVRLLGAGGEEGRGNLHRYVVMGLGPLHVGPDIEPAPWVPMDNPKDIKVIGKALEERGEAITALARSLIQGIEGTEPSSGRPNRVWLNQELADESATGRIVIQHFKLDEEAIVDRAQTKYDFLMKWLGMMGE